MDVHEELRALGPKLDAVENDILLTVRQLYAVLAELDAPNLEGTNRERFLLGEKTRLSKREELLRSEKLLLLAKEQQLRKKEEDLRARLPAPQQQGAEPPFLFFSKEKLGLRKIFPAVASCC